MRNIESEVVEKQMYFKPSVIAAILTVDKLIYLVYQARQYKVEKLHLPVCAFDSITNNKH